MTTKRFIRWRIEEILRLPRDIRRLADELARLNQNLEALHQHSAEVTDIVADMRTMTAGLLGWRVRTREDVPA